MAFGYGHPTIDSAEAAVAGGIGAGAGVVQAVALDVLDSNGSLGAPVIGGIKNSQLADLAVGGVAGGLGVAGAFGKGPLKAKQGAASAAAGYGIASAVVGILFIATKYSVAAEARQGTTYPYGYPDANAARAAAKAARDARNARYAGGTAPPSPGSYATAYTQNRFS
jgi:hypothetical protein